MLVPSLRRGPRGAFPAAALSLLLLPGGVAGCSPVPLVISDAPGADAGPPALTLTPITPGPVGLPFGSSTEIVVALTDGGGRPRAGEPVSFALDGSGADVSLEALESSTDGDGEARVRLSAGERPASFRVRANHPLASPVWIDVTVAASFGALVTVPIYDGARTVDGWTVALFRGGDCATALAAPIADAARVIRAASGEARFSALATDVSYTAVVRGESTSPPVTTAIGCVMGVGVLADRDVRVEVHAVDAPLVLGGTYEVAVALDAADAVTDPLAAFLSAAVVRAGDPTDDATRMLEALETELAADSAGLAALARLRAGGASERLASELVLTGDAPTEQLGALMDGATAALFDLRFEGTLTVASGVVATISLRRVVAASEGGAPLTLGLSTAVPVVLVVTAVSEADVLNVDRLSFPLSLGEVLAAVVVAQRDAARATSPGDVFGDAPCDALAAFVDEDAALALACDTDCVAAACGAALDATWQTALGEPYPLDAVRSSIELSGTLDLSDADGDLSVDGLHGTLAGSYVALDGLSDGPISAELSAASTIE